MNNTKINKKYFFIWMFSKITIILLFYFFLIFPFLKILLINTDVFVYIFCLMF